MQGLQQTYRQYFNLRQRKVGHVFQGRYKAIICHKSATKREMVGGRSSLSLTVVVCRLTIGNLYLKQARTL